MVLQRKHLVIGSALAWIGLSDVLAPVFWYLNLVLFFGSLVLLSKNDSIQRLAVARIMTGKRKFWIPFFFIFCFSGSNLKVNPELKEFNQKFDASYSPAPVNPVKKDSQKNWFEGGNLHKVNMLKWKQANLKNKLATSADFIAGSLSNKDIKAFSISNMDELKPYSIQLTLCLDTAYKASEKNKKTNDYLKNQAVSEVALMCMYQMNWIKD